MTSLDYGSENLESKNVTLLFIPFCSKCFAYHNHVHIFRMMDVRIFFEPCQKRLLVANAATLRSCQSRLRIGVRWT